MRRGGSNPAASFVIVAGARSLPAAEAGLGPIHAARAGWALMQLIADVDKSDEQRARRLKSVAPIRRGGTLKGRRTVRRPRHRKAQMAIFIALKRPGPPAREVLVNLDQILMVQPGQGSGSAILFGREHSVSFEEDVPTVIRRIQTGPYIRLGQA